MANPVSRTILSAFQSTAGTGISAAKAASYTFSTALPFAATPLVAYAAATPALADYSSSSRWASPVSSTWDVLAAEAPKLKPLTSVFGPKTMLGIFAKNVGLHCLLAFNMFMVDQLDYEQRALQAEQNGEPAGLPPSFPNMAVSVMNGVWASLREMSVRFVRTVYEHLLTARLGYQRAKPFLRDGIQWVSKVLVLKHTTSSTSARFYSYTFALLHAHALLYAADLTVYAAIHAYSVIAKGQGTAWQQARQVLKGLTYHAIRCTVVLLSSSVLAAAVSLYQPGLGTRVAWLASDLAANTVVQSTISPLLLN